MELIYQRKRFGSDITLTFFIMILLIRQNYQCHGFSALSYPKDNIFKPTSRMLENISNMPTKRNLSCFLHSSRSNNNPKIRSDGNTFSRHSYPSNNRVGYREYTSLSSLYLSPITKDRLFTLISSSCETKSTPIINHRITALHSTPNQPTRQSTPYHSSTPSSTTSTITNNNDAPNTLSGYKAPQVNWYPGHIAKAERNLAETLKSADVLVEVRDARIPKATSHPKVREWIAGKPRIIVLTRVDMVPRLSQRKWTESFERFGASRWDDSIDDGNLRHQINQNLEQQGKNKLDNKGIVEDAIYVDAKHGRGIPSLHRSIVKAGTYVNRRRTSRGLRERPLRVAILGYPNVGKSALINRILGRKRAKSANTPGITRALQWIRVRSTGSGGLESSTDVHGRAKIVKGNPNKGGKKSGGGTGGSGADYELLDSPGIIPANMENQEDAVLLAICNSIGNGAYDNQSVAAYLCERLKTLVVMGREADCCPHWQRKFADRYKFNPLDPIPVPSLRGEEEMRIPTGEDLLFKVADNTCRGDPENAARKILQDFRSGRLGPMALQLAPEADNDGTVDVRRNIQISGETPLVIEGEDIYGSIGSLNANSEKVKEERAKVAIQVAKEKGLELPPMVRTMEKDTGDEEESSDADETNIGKGMFDGW